MTPTHPYRSASSEQAAYWQAMRQWAFWASEFLDQEDVDWIDDVLAFCPEPRLPEADESGADWRGLAIMDGCGLYRMRGRT